MFSLVQDCEAYETKDDNEDCFRYTLEAVIIVQEE